MNFTFAGKKEETESCGHCYGRGSKQVLQSYGAFNGFRSETCRHCNGTGRVKKS